MWIKAATIGKRKPVLHSGVSAQCISIFLKKIFWKIRWRIVKILILKSPFLKAKSGKGFSLYKRQSHRHIIYGIL
jgi:hypothetical protein